MRTIQALAMISLVAAGMAGCVSNDGANQPLDDGVLSLKGGNSGPEYDGFSPPSPDNSHPAYGYAVYQPIDGKLAGGWEIPEMKALPDPLAGMHAENHVEGTTTGGGIAIFGTLAFIGVRGGAAAEMQVVDISVPGNARVVGVAKGVPVRDADTIAFPNGRLIVITTGGGLTQYATDVTDPTNPVLVGAIETPRSNHNIAVVPGTPLTYNSGGDVVNWYDPANPELVMDENGEQLSTPRGCHDITFFISQERDMYRAYCAGFEVSSIWDIADPFLVETIIDIPYPSANKGLPEDGGPLPDVGEFPLSFSHLALPNQDASVLIMGDETGGGLLNACDFYANAAGNTLSGPSGNLWFYDITNEREPVLHGHYSPNYAEAAGGSCTAHFGRVVEDTNTVVMGFYSAGVALVDFNDLDNPRQIDRFDDPLQPTSGIWDVWYYQGNLYTGDMDSGMNVLGFH